MSKKSSPPPSVPFRGAVALLVLGLAESALSVFQWLQLLTLREGGETGCGFSEKVNCETVWNSAFASQVHERLGIPVAGLGVVWGLIAVGLAALYLAWRRAGRSVTPAIAGLRLVAVAGVLASGVFAVASAGAGAVCPTCLATYALVLGFAGVAWRGLPAPLAPQPADWAPALTWTGGIAVAAFLALLGPGRATPKVSAGAVALMEKTGPAEAPVPLEDYLRKLSPAEQQQVSNALAQYRRGTPLPAPTPGRNRYGPASAPVKLVEWTDSKCSHCKSFVEALAVLKRRVPAGSLSVEARQFPLDGLCNPLMPMRSGPDEAASVRCVAAKAQICLEDAPDFWSLREKLFAVQAQLNVDRVWEIATSGSVPREKLEACMKSPDTARKIQDDIAYAKQHHIRGTPLVVINGRDVAPAPPPFIYALVMAGGDASAKAFDLLPPPAAVEDAHAGHQH